MHSKNILLSTLASIGLASGTVTYAGVNIAGFDFGCTTDGTCDLTKTTPPGDGAAQIQHFVTDTGLNAFRLPVGWQYLVNNNLGGPLDSGNFGNYDNLVQACVNAGAKFCLVDIHNYARWNGGIIGQGGPSDDQFVNLWTQLATKYASQPNVAFGIMNEPHDLDITTWAATVQAVVTAIRQAGATDNLILLPGTDYTSAGLFTTNGSGDNLLKVVNPDNSTKGLIFDVHQYLDSDYSGTATTCVHDQSGTFTSLAQWLSSNGRQAMLTETGGGASDSSCLDLVCGELSTLNSNSDQYLGWTTWAAGSFDQTYPLVETPMGSAGSYTDQPLVKQCVAGVFLGTSS